MYFIFKKRKSKPTLSFRIEDLLSYKIHIML